ncbi:PAS domain S-box protein [Cesiribacter andamanensis]|uniref:Putative sensor histidine kinase pdtaS n=1 Tax=Cesiribacter andamanensis AMV16 TaxID=1279009 RepID=M7P028_9BACT|nr:PAS domain S-box protein [Cesiribacter andamanensis]EMR03974.1 putative sensor histidine kinase pdtaS [Cesiribacter andamanensis AMV16]
MWVYTAITPFLDPEGRLTHSVHICKDITQRKNTEQALKESEKLYRSLIENYSDAIFITDVQGRIAIANQHAELLTGSPAAALMTTNLLDLLPAEARSQLSTGLPLILQGKNLQIESKMKGMGAPFTASIAVGAITEGNRVSRFFFTIKDISKKVDYEKDLALLNNTSRALSSAYSLKEGATAVLQLLCQYTGFQYGEFWMPMLGQTHTRMKAYWEAGNDYWPVTSASIDRTWDMASEKKHLFGTGKPYFVPDIRLDASIRRKGVALACGLQAFFSIPIVYRNKTLGVLGLWAAQRQENPDFDPAHLQSLMEKLGAEIERRQNNEAFKKFFTLTPDLFCIIGFDGLPKRANPALQELLGYSADDYGLLPVAELIHPDDAERGRAALEKIYRGDTCQNLELRIRCKDASYRWLAFTTQSSLADNLIYLVGRDITQQKQQREELERIMIAIENTSDAIGIATSPEEVVYTNAAFLSTLGWDVPRMNAIGGPRGMFVDPAVPTRIIEDLYALGQWEGDIDIYDAYGSIRLFYLRCTAVLDEQQQFKYLVGIFIDVAQKRQAQEELLKLNQAVEDSGNEVYIINTITRKFSYINKKGLDNLGYQRNELASLSPLDVNPDYDRLQYKKLFHPLLIGQENSLTYQTTHKRRDGSLYPVEVYLTLFHHGSETSIMAHAIDITERKQAEEELRIINERYRLVTKATQDAIWDWDLVNKKGYFGEGYATLFGQDPSLGSLPYWSDHLHPLDRDRVLANLTRVVNSLRTEWTIEYRYRCADGSYKFVKDRGYVIRDADGRAIRITGALADISEHKNSEELLRQFNAELEAKVTQKTARLATTLTKMQQEMLAREQVEANLHQSLQEKEVLLKEIHHRVKNNMAIISGLLSLQARHSQQPEVRTLFRESQQRIKSMALTHELLYQHKNLSRINFQKYIQELTQGISYSFRSSQTSVQLQIQADAADLDIVQAVPCGLILNELITNAYKYAFHGKQEGAIAVKFKQKGDLYSLEVSDNGHGLPAQFESSQSTSLGMQLVNSLVRQLGGSLHSYSEGGAHFLITFTDTSPM